MRGAFSPATRMPTYFTRDAVFSGRADHALVAEALEAACAWVLREGPFHYVVTHASPDGVESNERIEGAIDHFVAPPSDFAGNTDFSVEGPVDASGRRVLVRLYTGGPAAKLMTLSVCAHDQADWTSAVDAFGEAMGAPRAPDREA